MLTREFLDGLFGYGVSYCQMHGITNLNKYSEVHDFSTYGGVVRYYREIVYVHLDNKIKFSEQGLRALIQCLANVYWRLKTSEIVNGPCFHIGHDTFQLLKIALKNISLKEDKKLLMGEIFGVMKSRDIVKLIK